MCVVVSVVNLRPQRLHLGDQIKTLDRWNLRLAKMPNYQKCRRVGKIDRLFQEDPARAMSSRLMDLIE
jgi:hypothetical protein